jgi:hypothetical protein
MMSIVNDNDGHRNDNDERRGDNDNECDSCPTLPLFPAAGVKRLLDEASADELNQALSKKLHSGFSPPTPFLICDNGHRLAVSLRKWGWGRAEISRKSRYIIHLA